MSLVYSNAGLDDAAERLLAEGLGPHRIVRGAATQSILHAGVSDVIGEAEIVFGQPDPPALLAAPKLRWVQLTTAGWTRYDTDELRAWFTRRDVTLCSSSRVFAEPVAEHAIAAMLALARQLPAAMRDQAGARSWPQAALRRNSHLLRDELVLLVGYGAIARAIATRLRGFGVRMVGYRRRVRGDEEIPIVERAGLDAALAEADHVLDLLPEGAETRGFFGATRFSRMKPGARFYNLGRGATVDQDELLAALSSGHLDAAWLDVTTPEPLPGEHPLWSSPRVYLTPHTAGGQRHEASALVRHFLANLRAYEAGQPLLDRVL